MLDLFAQDGLRLFSIMACLVLALLVLEILLMMMGASSQIGEPTGDIGLDVDVGGVDLDTLDLDPGLAAQIDTDTAVAGDIAPDGLAHHLGLHDTPSAIWLAGLLAFCAVFGFILQGTLGALGIGYLPGWMALLVVAAPALLVNSRFARLLGRIVPPVQTTAISDRAFHQRRARITGGPAIAGMPTEVEWTDGYGNRHYLLAEPLDPNDTIANGSEVLLVRTREGSARILPLS